MSLRSTFFGMLIAASMLFAADLVIQRMSGNSVPRQVIKNVSDAPRVIDVLGVGNSLMAAGFDPYSIRQVLAQSSNSVVAVNAGLGSSSVIEHLALTRLALSHHAVKTLVYGFFDQQLASDPVRKNSDLIGNYSMMYYLEPQLTWKYAPFDPIERLSFQLFRSSALLRERSTIWSKVELLRRAAGSVGMHAQRGNEPVWSEGRLLAFRGN